MRIDKVQTANLFATPVLTETWSEAPTANLELKHLIQDRRKTGQGVELSNILGWQSDDGMTMWGGVAAQSLRDHVIRRCNELTLDVAQTDERRYRWVTNMWANVSPPGASNQTHSHPGAFWSAVYYVDDGYEGDEDRSLGGELVFLDPRMPYVRAVVPNLRRRRSDGSQDHHESWFRPSSGRLVIFPSWLMHSVRPYRGKADRISIALNLAPRALNGHTLGRTLS